ncbi:MAG: amidase, partial [Pseudomonadota bacterium]
FASTGPVGPLHGVPITIKENVDQAGHATPNGVIAYKDVMASEDAPLVRNLKSAGAVVIGRTNTPEFSFRATTVNELHGRTKSPWNDWVSSGGSSGGASSAVMAGMCALAHGNDIGGSLRYPAAAVGGATVKPGLGRVPAFNPSAPAERGLLAQLMSVQGIIARTVADVRLGTKVIIGHDARDPWHVPMPFDGPALDGPIKVAFTKNMFEFDLAPEVSDALDTARHALTDAGYTVEEVEPPLVREAAREGSACLFGEMQVLLEDQIRQHGSETINKIFDAYYEIFQPYSGDDLIRGLAKRTHYIRAWTTFMEQYPLVLTPFHPTQTFKWDRDAEGVEGAREVLQVGIYSIAMNFMGLPAGNVPAGFNNGLPIGVQIVGRRFREDLILDACEAVEQRVGVMADRLFARDAA